MPRLQVNQWSGEQLRLSLFTLGARGERASVWWQSVTGIPPEQLNSLPRVGATTASGAVDIGTLLLNVAPDRVDWLLHPHPASGAESPSPTLGNLVVAVDLFMAIVSRWIAAGDLPQVVRLALGAVATHPVESPTEGYSHLTEYLPTVIPPGSSDFLYQINRPTDSTVLQGIRINRLSKWSVARWMFVPLISPAVEREVYGLNVELDVNTVPRDGFSVPSDLLVSGSRELIANAFEVLAQGVMQ